MVLRSYQKRQIDFPNQTNTVPRLTNLLSFGKEGVIVYTFLSYHFESFSSLEVTFDDPLGTFSHLDFATLANRK